MFLKELTELCAVSGCEYQVRDFIKKCLNDIDCKYEIDRMGNIIAHNEGKKRCAKLMFEAHMDEIGLIIYFIDENGFLRFKPVGKQDFYMLHSKTVSIGRKNVIGVIGSNPIHLTKPEDRGKLLEPSDLYIDIGAANKEEAERVVKIGDYAAVKSEFILFGDNKMKGKAIGSRVGCQILLDLLSNHYDIDFFCLFSVMKEVGRRGVIPAVFSYNPEVLVSFDEIESAVCLNGIQDNMATVLGGEPVITFTESNWAFDQELIMKYIKLADEKKIKYQLKGFCEINSDASNAAAAFKGCRTFSLMLPCRNPASPITIADIRDYGETVNFAEEIIKN